MLSILFIILLFASLVIFHEWGHFILAKRNGVEVEEFGIGFPPKLFGRKWRGTEYTFNLLPLGGFVRLKGEDAADKTPGSFNGAKYLAKAKILLAGVGMNLIAAVVILYGLCLTGLPGLGAAFEPGFLKSSYAQPKQLLLAKVEPGSPADKAGLKRGDFVLSANGRPLATDVDLHAFTQDHAGQKVKLEVKQSGADKTIEVQLRDPKAKDGFLGVSAQQVYKLRYDPLTALAAAIYITGSLFVATIVGVSQLLINIPTLLLNVFSHNVPAAAEAASGPVGIVYIMQSMSSLGMSYIMLFMANISVALAAFNVLPLPALDGGRLAVITVQRITKRQWSADAEARYHAIGFMALIGLILLISVYDLRKYF